MAPGLALLAGLPGCASRIELPVDRPVPVAVPLERTPPAELLACARRDAPLPSGAESWAVIPPAVRAALIALARAAGENADRLDRLVNWNAPGRCPAKESK